MRFLAFLREMPKHRRKIIGQSINTVHAAFGNPHQHAGIGIRRLKGNFFECRAGLTIRLVFEILPGTIRFHTAGNHDDIQRLIRNLK